MNKLRMGINGIKAGFVATAAVCILMMIQTASGQIPELHMIRTLSGVLGAPTHVLLGLGIHFVIGVLIWGSIYALMEAYVPLRSPVLKGMGFGICAWLLMMLVLMPLAGAGFFASARGTLLVPIGTLIYHLVYGAVLGTVYESSLPSAKQSHHRHA